MSSILSVSTVAAYSVTKAYEKGWLDGVLDWLSEYWWVVLFVVIAFIVGKGMREDKAKSNK